MALSIEKRSENSFAVGSFDAKTHFSELLRTVEQGSVITITRNGHDIATIISPALLQSQKKSNALLAWQTLRKIVGSSSQKDKNALSVQEIQEFKNDGRK